MHRGLAMGALCLGLVGCGPPEAPRPNVVLVLVDQLRKDSADAWLHETNALAADGVVFEQMRAAAPWTYPSVVSMMTGLYPQQHGADGHMRKKVLSYLGSDVPTIQKVLQGAGYQTAGFVTNPFLHTWNAFHQGFDHFDASFVNHAGNRKAGTKVVVWVPETMYGDSVNRAVFAHYDAVAPTAPEFTYIHYIGVHGPHFDAPFEPNLQAAVEFTDERIREAYDYFLARYAGNLVFVVTSDHGLDRGDDRRVGDGPFIRKSKGSVHDYNLRIPFMVLGSPRVAGPVEVDVACSNIDIAPTIAEWAGVELPLDVPGLSLVPAIAGDTRALDERPVYARVSSFKRLSDGLVYRGRKYIRHYDAQTGELTRRFVFDLEADPREVRSLSNDFGPVAELIKVAAGDHGLAWSPDFGDLPTDTRRQLEALGYLTE